MSSLKRPFSPTSSRVQSFRRRRLLRLVSILSAATITLLFLSSSSPLRNDDYDDYANDYDTTPSIGRVFIAANLWKAEHVLESYWIPALVSLIMLLGKDNVFVSITASPGKDNTLSILSTFDKQLNEMGIARKIVLGWQTHEQFVKNKPQDGDVGWVTTRKGNRRWRRIPYLVNVRNEALEPLMDPAVVNGTHSFDKILFINDIYFTAHQALELLHTRGGRYAAACGLDFYHDPTWIFYDSMVMRDSQGRRVVSSEYPYFGPGKSRDALLRGDPVPVQSCWNGMAAFDARPFLPPNSLRFRSIEDSLATNYVEASECCLIHVDNPETARQGVWVNPRVRVAYKEYAYNAVQEWPTLREEVKGLFIRAWSSFFSLPWPKAKVEKAYEKWTAENATRHEPGKFCLWDEMQVLSKNGWTLLL